MEYKQGSQDLMKIKYQNPEHEENERGNVKVDYNVSESGLD